MARTRPTSKSAVPPEGPPGLGGIPAGENPPPPVADSADSADSSGTNHELKTESATHDIPWSGRGDPSDLGLIRADLREEGDRLNTLWSEFADQNAVVEQIGAQLRMVEQTVGQGMPLLEQCKNAIIMLEQRVNALAQQQLQTNTRLAAAQLAAQSTKGHESPGKVIEQAERWYRFLMQDLIAKAVPISSQEEVQPDGLDPEGTTQH